MKTPFFSIVIPIYNRSHLICGTIDSILNQSYINYEVILVNDGSTDNTKEILELKYGNDPKFQIIHKINEERAKARNVGFEKSCGEYVIFFDSDDIMLSDYLQVLKENILKLAPNFISCKWIYALPNGQFFKKGLSRLKGNKYYNYKELLNGNAFGCHLAVKRDLPGLVKFREERSLATMEDWIFLLENLKTDKLYLIDHIGVQMIVHDQQSMADNQIVINKRLEANRLMSSDLSLDPQELKLLNGNSYYFCAIHASLDKNRKQALSYLLKSFKQLGVNTKLLALFVKVLVGRNGLAFINNVISRS